MTQELLQPLDGEDYDILSKASSITMLLPRITCKKKYIY